MQRKKIGFISLGCDKNRVDLEKIIYRFKQKGYEITNNQEEANVIVINTCGFIGDAKKESVEAILDCAKLKENDLEMLVVCGCLVNAMNEKELKESLPEVDAFVNIKSGESVISHVEKFYKKSKIKQNKFSPNRVSTTPSHYAYLKISDGCNNFCTYCLIPHIKGRLKSEKQRSLIKEAKKLVKSGVKELILVAQDLAKYGSDLKCKVSIITLLNKLEKIKNLETIRLLYCYPDTISSELIEKIKTSKKIAKYIDIPLQHISDNILKKMNRRTNKKQVCELIKKLRNEIPNIVIRSTFIVGFPGETEEDVNEICNFLTKYKLDNVGFFKYSREEHTPAGKMKEQIPAKTKEARLKRVYKTQFEVAQEKLKKYVSKNMFCIVDEYQNDVAICHNELFCPDIDGTILVENCKAKIGEKIKVKIINFNDYDLVAKQL